jgi:hypothetical protein
MIESDPPTAPGIQRCRALKISFLFAALLIVPVEWLCATAALETQGEVNQAALMVLVAANVLPIAFFKWFPRAAFSALLSLGLLIIPYQVTLMDRLIRLNFEMMRLVDSRTRLRLEGRSIPVALDDFRFSNSGLRKFVYHYDVAPDGKSFSVYYFVVQPGITHSYSSDSGWSYYPD